MCSSDLTHTESDSLVVLAIGMSMMAAGLIVVVSVGVVQVVLSVYRLLEWIDVL